MNAKSWLVISLVIILGVSSLASAESLLDKARENQLGYISLGIFFVVLITSLKGWIPQDKLPIQSAMILSTFLILIIASFYGKHIGFKELNAYVFLHPITALIAGFLVAGAMKAAGAFDAAVVVLERLTTTPLGLVGTVVIMVNIPTIFQMPCGRIWAAALMPVAILFGITVARKKNNPLLISVVVFAFIINAAASCGPSPLGGIGMVGEGLGGYPLGSLANSQQLGILFMTGVAALVVRFVTKVLPSEDMILKSSDTAKIEVKDVPKSGYISLALFGIGLMSIFLIQPPIPIQTLLVLLVLVIMVIGKASINDLIAGINLHPIMAMTAGFLIAGAILLAGGFDALTDILLVLTTTPLGIVGVAVILVNIPTILPMPCGRIIGVALVPGVVSFGKAIIEANPDLAGNQYIVPALLAAFIVNAAASCGPSPLGGIGSIGEGNLGTDVGASTRLQQIGITVGTGIAGFATGVMGVMYFYT